MEIARLVVGRVTTIYSCDATTLVTDAARILAENRIGALPVVDGTQVIGMFSERDLLYAIASQGAAALDKTVGEVMTSPVVSVHRDTSAMEALGLMTRRRIRHLPVVEDDKLVGFVSIGDLVKLRVEEAEAEAEAMRAYIQTA